MKPDWRPWTFLAMGTQLAVTMAVSIAGGLLAGIWIDGKLGTAPLGTLVLMLVGLALGSLTAYRTLISALELLNKGKVKRPDSRKERK